jgi:hypothetical protein
MSDDEDQRDEVDAEIVEPANTPMSELLDDAARRTWEVFLERGSATDHSNIAPAVQVGGYQNVVIHQSAGGVAGAGEINFLRDDARAAEDPRQLFLSRVRDLALTEASSAAKLARVFMSLGAVIVLVGGALAVLRVGISHGTSTGWVTALGGVLVGTVGGAFRLHANHERKNLEREAAKVVEELHSDHSREEALVLIDRVEDPVLRDRLRSITAMRTLGLAPAPDEAAKWVSPPGDHARAEIEPPADPDE